MGAKLKFLPSRDGFSIDLRARVDAHFAGESRSRHADTATMVKGLFWVLTCVGLYAGLVSGFLPGALVLLLGFAIAEVGFNVGHDAIHHATSRHAWLNTVLGFSFDLLGGSSYSWSRAHNFVHHTYTNMPGVDKDLDADPWMDFRPPAGGRGRHRNQHWYAFAYYTLTMLVWAFVKDFIQLSAPDPRTRKRTPRWAWAGVLAGKLVHFTVFLGVPLALYPGPAWHVVVGYVLMQMAVGLTLAIVFQLAHVVEGPEYPEADAQGQIHMSWAEHQLRTTANFSTGGAWATFFTGGLNHQIEHHLFPRISHAHYGALAHVVRRTALEHGLPYHENATFLAAVASHLRTMRRFGQAEVGPAEISQAEVGRA